jgi:putative colanic acid biosynthesis acetyltransferase WcaF
MNRHSELRLFDNKSYKPGNYLLRFLWLFLSFIFFEHGLSIGSFWKVSILKMFGAKIGGGVVIKPNVHIKYPWFLSVGNNTWLGEKVWIDNLCMVTIGSNVCISQGAYLLTGNHDYKISSFNLIVKEINLEDGVWIGAKSIVCPGVICKTHAVLTAGSVATKNLEAYSIYQGNPAIKIKDRVLEK